MGVGEAIADKKCSGFAVSDLTKIMTEASDRSRFRKAIRRFLQESAKLSDRYGGDPPQQPYQPRVPGPFSSPWPCRACVTSAVSM